MVSLFSLFAVAVLASVLVLSICLPADFRKTFFSPATLGERLLVKSLGLVAIATLIAEFAVGRGPDNGMNGLSPCLAFGVYGGLVFYVRAACFLWNRRSQEQLPLPRGIETQPQLSAATGCD